VRRTEDGILNQHYLVNKVVISSSLSPGCRSDVSTDGPASGFEHAPDLLHLSNVHGHRQGRLTRAQHPGEISSSFCPPKE